jgi:hypothetical protein
MRRGRSIGQRNRVGPAVQPTGKQFHNGWRLVVVVLVRDGNDILHKLRLVRVAVPRLKGVGYLEVLAGSLPQGRSNMDGGVYTPFRHGRVLAGMAAHEPVGTVVGSSTTPNSTVLGLQAPASLLEDLPVLFLPVLTPADEPENEANNGQAGRNTANEATDDGAD